jgi:PleD family two-component response regulator
MKNATPKNPKKISSYNKNLITDKKELLKGKRILIVDDSKTVRTLSKNCLLHSGYNFLIETAQNPIEAFKILSQKHFDLILTDIEMPEMNGFEFLTQLKTNEMYFDIPVIVISSLSDKNVKKRAKSLGAEDYVIKEDFKEKNILDKISNILLKSIN